MKTPLKAKWLTVQSIFVCTFLLCNSVIAEAQLTLAQSELLVLADSILDSKDTRFLEHSAEISLREIKRGEYAQNNSKNTEVIALGKMMSQAHASSLKRLNLLAGKKLVLVPGALNGEDQTDFNSLSTKEGKEFDMEYCDMVIDEHEKAIVVYSKIIEDTEDAEVLEFATSELSVLRSHLTMAEKCQKNCEKEGINKSK